MVNGATLEIRRDSACEYLTALASSFKIPWIDSLNQARSPDRWITRMALVHPEHYEGSVRYLRDLSVTCDCPVRGPRSFAKEIGLNSMPCASNRIWGYPCPIHDTGSLAADHLFPYSLGGPTSAGNKIYLCHWHNQIKAADIHIFPWEKGPPEWLDDVLKRVEMII